MYSIISKSQNLLDTASQFAEAVHKAQNCANLRDEHVYIYFGMNIKRVILPENQNKLTIINKDKNEQFRNI